jgi:cell wall-associated NlpC family hydrolase
VQVRHLGRRVRKLLPSKRLIVLVALCLLSAAAAVAAASPARAAAKGAAPYAVTLHLSAMQVTAGTTVTYTGSVQTAAGVRGTGVVTLQKRPATGGRWTAWRKVTIGSGGVYSVAVLMKTADRVWQFRARMPADGGANLAGVSAVQNLSVTVPPAPYVVTLSLSAAQVSPGASVTYSGSVHTAAGVPAAGKVMIQKRLAAGGSWIDWRGVTLAADGSYAVAVPMKTGDRVWEFQACMPADGAANLAAASAVQTLTVTTAEVPPPTAGVLAVARTCLGVPYVWAGASMSGFDCSGLTMYCYAQVGVSLPHGATGQQKLCAPVPLVDVQPGDLVFFGTPGNYYHVGIYAGDGAMIDAPHSGAVVRYDPITGAACAGRP